MLGTVNTRISFLTSFFREEFFEPNFTSWLFQVIFKEFQTIVKNSLVKSTRI